MPGTEHRAQHAQPECTTTLNGVSVYRTKARLTNSRRAAHKSVQDAHSAPQDSSFLQGVRGVKNAPETVQTAMKMAIVGLAGRAAQTLAPRQVRHESTVIVLPDNTSQ